MTITTLSQSASSNSDIGGQQREWNWTWERKSLQITYEVRGEGLPLLLLPAFSTVSTRSELRGLADVFAPHWQVWALDWPGFGQSSRGALSYQAELYRQFLQSFVQSHFETPVAVVAAGHAAGYVLQVAQHHPSPWSKIALVAPTWRGPLPTMGAPSQVATAVREMVRSPLLGQMLYKLNTVPSFLAWMYRRHVFTEAEHLTPDFIQTKYQITQQPGARFAPAAFVTGALDPAQNRSEWLAWFQDLSIPVMVILAEQAPPASRAEMEALSSLPNVQAVRLPGSLGLHEEYAAEVGSAILPFLMA